MYAVIHGGIDDDLRRKSCEYLSSLPFDGFAIGGSIGKNKTEMFNMLTNLMPVLNKNCPNHLLGIGDLHSLDLCVPLGIDTFDSSYPTRAARHALLLTKKGGIKVTKKMYSTCFEPIEEECTCFTCKNYHLAYIHHLFKAKEMIGHTLASIHNLHFMVELMKYYRQKIALDEI
jgi:queuine tRNA-ribosyltransferase